MIELRWLVRGDGHDDDPIERTLQYRCMRSVLRESGNVRMEWGLWHDVPEVKRGNDTEL